jgi:hypothetical protein
MLAWVEMREAHAKRQLPPGLPGQKRCLWKGTVVYRLEPSHRGGSGRVHEQN